MIDLLICWLVAGVLAIMHVRGGVVGVLPDQAGGGAGQDGAARHALPRPHQHLQQRQVGSRA